jgi:REP element-mobilizing transposase RayT
MATFSMGDAIIIIAYHAIFTTYGTWLPNDPRGSYSKLVYQAELAELGPILYGRQSPQPDRARMRRFRTEALRRLTRPAFYLSDKTRPTVAAAFASVASRLGLSISACSIMNEHVHFLVLRSGYRIEYLVNQFKGAATKELELSRTPWTRGSWKVYIDDDEALWAAAEYINANPRAAGLNEQRWGFVTPLTGRP